jgi:tripartite-type tricarboxylate transporter receptor subunit TctC
MKFSRRIFLHLAAGAATLPTLSRIARAQAYPARPVTIIIGFPPGGGIDLDARLMARWLSDRLGQPYIVENRPGPGTHAATEAVVHASADGHTLLLASAANTISPALFQNLNFKFIADVAPITGIARAPAVLVINPSLPAKTIPEFIAHAKRNKLTVGSTAIGTPPFMAAALFKTMTGTDIVQTPYQSDAGGVADLLDGKIQAHFAGSGAVMGHIKSGKLHSLAVTSMTRLEFLPDTAAMAEFVPTYEASTWIGLAAPRNTPPQIIDVLHREVTAGLADAKIRAGLGELGYLPMPMSSVEFSKFIVDETEKWVRVAERANIKPR